MSEKRLKIIRLLYVITPLLLLTILFAALFYLNTSRQRDEKSEEPSSSQKLTKKQNEPEDRSAVFGERIDERKRMVQHQIQNRGISEPNVLGAMQTVPRHSFVRDRDSRRAYSDQPLPIGMGQTISQPYIVAYMTEAMKLKSDYKILEIGTGSGYQAAVCAEIVHKVYTIEIIEELAATARKRLDELGYKNITVKTGDGYYGWEEKGPFDAIIVTAAAGLVPPALIKQLKPKGTMILPLGSPFGMQTLVLITKDEKETIKSKSLLPVRFVPMTGHVRKVR